MVIATIGYAFSLSQIGSQSRIGEGTYAIGVLMQTADAVNGIAEMKRASDVVQFTLNFGYISVSREGICSVQVEEDRVTINHYSIKYVCKNVIYPSEKIVDRGTSLLTHYSNVWDAGVVYHYSDKGKTYAVFEQRPSLVVIDNPDGSATVQIVMLELTPKTEPLVTNRGPISYTFKEMNTTTWGPYIDSTTVTFNVMGEVDTVRVTGTTIYVHIHTIKVLVG